MYKIIYFSTARKDLKEKELNELLLKARAYNVINNITGILLSIEGDFLQILEGTKENVEFLYEKIKKDDRHNEIVTISESRISERQFPDWSMGFKLTGYIDIDKIESLEFFNKNVINDDDKLSNDIIKTFLDSRKKNNRYKLI